MHLGYLALLAGVVQVLGSCLAKQLHLAKEIQAPAVTSLVTRFCVPILFVCSLCCWSLCGLCWPRSCHSPALGPQDSSVRTWPWETQLIACCFCEKEVRAM